MNYYVSSSYLPVYVNITLRPGAAIPARGPSLKFRNVAFQFRHQNLPWKARESPFKWPLLLFCTWLARLAGPAAPQTGLKEGLSLALVNICILAQLSRFAKVPRPAEKT